MIYTADIIENSVPRMQITASICFVLPETQIHVYHLRLDCMVLSPISIIPTPTGNT